MNGVSVRKWELSSISETHQTVYSQLMPPSNRDLCLHPLEGIHHQPAAGVTGVIDSHRQIGALNPPKTPPTHIPTYEMNELNKFPTVGMLMETNPNNHQSRPTLQFSYESVSGVDSKNIGLGGQQESKSLEKSSCQRVVSSSNIRFPLEVGEIVFTATHENHHTVSRT